MNIFLLFLTSALFITSVNAQQILNRIVQNNEIRVGLTGSQPPFSMESVNGGTIGYDVDLARLLADALGVRVKFIRMPFSDLLEALENSDVDAVVSGLTITPQRNLRVAFVGPYLVTGKSLLTKSEKFKDITSSDDLNSRKVKIATLRGSTSEDYVKENIPESDLILVDEYDEAVQMVRNGEIDVMLADYSECSYAALRYSDEKLFVNDHSFTIERIGMALPPNDPLMINMMQNFFDELNLKGEFERLEEKWFHSGSWLMNIK